MLNDLLQTLDTPKREKLREFGIDYVLLSHWRTGKRLPTEVQTIALAEICGVDRHKLQDEIAMLRATPEQRKLLERVMGKARGAVAMLIFGVTVAVAGAALGLSAAGPGGLFRRR